MNRGIRISSLEAIELVERDLVLFSVKGNDTDRKHSVLDSNFMSDADNSSDYASG